MHSKHILFIFLLILSNTVTGQKFPYLIKGQITENGRPAADVRIELNDNPQISSITDSDGFYSISTAKPDASLVLKKDGYESKIVNVNFSGNENRITYANFEFQQNVVKLEEIVISDNPSLVTNSRLGLQRQIDRIPGGAVLMDLSDLKSQRSYTLKDAIGNEPGVIVQDFFGGNDQPRLNIRGSGIQSNPQTRGVSLLQDGIPINLSDGSYIIGLLEPQASHLVEIFKGSNGMQYGSATLGGAINFITKNGYNASPLAAKIEGGSFDYINGSLSTGTRFGKNDIFFATSYNHSNGFREHNKSQRLNALVNMGRKFSDKFESRLLVNFTDMRFDIPGPLNRAQMKANPKQVNAAPEAPYFGIGPNVVRDLPGRNSKVLRVGNRNVYKINSGSRFEGTLYYQYSDDKFVFPIPEGIRKNLGNDGGVRIAYTHETTSNFFTVGGNTQFGRIHQRYYINKMGKEGGLFSDNHLDAAHYLLYINDVMTIIPGLQLTGTLQTVWDNRNISELMIEPITRPVFTFMNGGQSSAVPSAPLNHNYHFFGINPRAGIIFSPSKEMQLFAGFSRSFEPPTFIELIDIEGGNPNTSPNSITIADITAQKASTAELGFRGKTERLNWDVSLYNSWLQGELLTLTDINGITGNTINSPSGTVHRGIEAKLNMIVLRGLFTDMDRINMIVAYTFSDFYFTGGQDKGNQIGGIPRHYLASSIQYNHPAGLFVSFNAESLPQKTPIDHHNDLYQNPYTLLNARVGFQKSRWGIFAEGRNLTDKNYASSYLIRDRAVIPPMPPNATAENPTNFIPGVGINFLAGINFTL